MGSATKQHLMIAFFFEFFRRRHSLLADPL